MPLKPGDAVQVIDPAHPRHGDRGVVRQVYGPGHPRHVPGEPLRVEVTGARHEYDIEEGKLQLLPPYQPRPLQERMDFTGQLGWQEFPDAKDRKLPDEPNPGKPYSVEVLSAPDKG